MNELGIETQIESNLEPPTKKTKALFSYMTEQEENTNPHNNIHIDEYLDAPCVTMDINPTKFWSEKEWPVLAKLAKNVLAVPASSSSVERLFSIAGKIFRPERCRLSDHRFQSLMFIRCNNNLKC